MSAETPRRPSPGEAQPVAETVGRKAARKLRSRREGRRSVWFGLGLFGLIGWAVALPSVAGVALGLWLDRRFPSRISWALTCLVVGALFGSLNAWFWVQRESRHD